LKRLIPVILAAMLFALLFGAMASAKIYKYQDEDGNWHFTDTPPENADYETDPMEGMDTRKSGLINLRESLYEKYHPSTPVETAAIATVSIKSDIGSGSGFFITADGHILTNKHVIRGDAQLFKKADKALDTIDDRLDRADKAFEAEKKRLEKIKRHLDKYKQAIDAMADGAAKEQNRQRYEIEKNRYEARRHDFRVKKSKYESRKATYEDQKSDYRYTTSTAALTRHFKIILKTGKVLHAYLVDTSSEQDLALLKVDGYQTPFIRPADIGPLNQGDRVYAIGSPMGLRDSVSNGVFSGFENNFIKTDAKIYPGNSGGPLINRDGRVVGINSFKKLTRHFEGLGFAIPIETAINEFNRHIEK